MFQIYMPTVAPDDWKRGLTDPDLHWKVGYSARALASCWENYKLKGLPPEINHIFRETSKSAFNKISLLIGLPEHHVILPGGSRASQNDLFLLAKDSNSDLISITVEGKVNETFGPTLDEWKTTWTSGKAERLAYIQSALGISQELPGSTRYQLLHRTASAVVEAMRFNAKSAIMIVHSFSTSDMWFDDFKAFVQLYKREAQIGQLIPLNTANGIDIYTAWVKGDAKWLQT